MYNIINDDYHLIKHIFVVIFSFVVLIECTLQRLVCDSSLVLYLLHVYTIYILALVYNDLTHLCIKWLLFCLKKSFDHIIIIMILLMICK